MLLSLMFLLYVLALFACLHLHIFVFPSLQLIDIMKRASAERSQSGRLPVQYVVILTKVDKASAKSLQSTRQAVMNLYDTISEINTPTPASAAAGAVDKNRPSAVDTAVATADTASSGRDMKKPKKARRESNSAITIIETSSTERIGREQLWQIILKVLEDRKKQLSLHSTEVE